MAISDRAAPETPEFGDGPSPHAGARMTLDEFLALPEAKPYLEFTDGLVTQKMAPKFVHGTIQTLLVQLLNRVAYPARLGMAQTETRYVTPEWAPVPDVSYYRRERIRRRGRELQADSHVPPDLVVEIVSPTQSVTALISKCLRHVSKGVAVVLLIDPAEKCIFAFRPNLPLRMLRGDDRIALDDLLPGFQLTVRELFDSLAPDWIPDELADDAAGTESSSE